MHHIFQRFADGLNDSRDPNDFRSTLEEAALALDLPCFAYARMPTQIDGAVSLIASYPSAWTDHYFECHYEALDPVILMAHQSVEPFVWGEEWNGPGLTERQKAFFEEAAAFGIRCGFTIPIRDGDGPIAAVTFASSEKRESFVRSITINRHVLQLMAISLHCHARRKLWPSNVVAGVRLSAREMECLVWAAEGKSAWATAKIIGVSDATVRFHLANVRTKLGVCSLRQAIRLLNRGQTLNP
jgi:DNA-binding CsgD family transcriptional regulator